MINLENRLNKLRLLGLDCEIKQVNNIETLNISKVRNKIDTVVIPEGIGVLNVQDTIELISHLRLPHSMVEIKKCNLPDLYKIEMNKLTLADGCEVIGDGVFEYGKFTEIVLPDTLKRIGHEAFAACKLKSIKIPENCIKIEEAAFQECAELSNVELPSKLERIEVSMFDCCESLQCVKLPESVTSISDNAFANSGLKTINIPKNCNFIGRGAFYNTFLEEVEIPEACKYVGDHAFSDCDNLRRMIIPIRLRNENFVKSLYRKTEIYVY